LTIDFKK